MPKITRYGGPSDRADIEPEPEALAANGSEQPSAETAPKAADEEPSRAAKKATTGRRKPARAAKDATPEQDAE